jgi:hypothetical protein
MVFCVCIFRFWSGIFSLRMTLSPWRRREFCLVIFWDGDVVLYFVCGFSPGKDTKSGTNVFTVMGEISLCSSVVMQARFPSF